MTTRKIDIDSRQLEKILRHWAFEDSRRYEPDVHPGAEFLKFKNWPVAITGLPESITITVSDPDA